MLTRVRALLAPALLLAALPLLPIPWGGVQPGGKLLIQLIAFSAVVLVALAPLERDTSPAFGLGRASRPLLILGATGLLGVVQLLPLSSSLLGAVSPASAEIYESAATTLALYGREAPTPRISIAPTDTLVTLLLVFAYVALFFAACRAFSTRGRRRAFAVVLLASAVGQAVYATLSATKDRASGSFINPNHLAGYLEIALAVAFGAIVWAVLVGRDRERLAKDPLDRLYKRWLPVAWAVVAWAVVAIGVAVTRSRGGILAAAVVTFAMLTMALLHGRGRYRKWIAAAEGAALAGGLAIVALTTGTYPLLRFLTSDPRDAASDLRVRLWKLSIDAWQEFPVFGAGLGAYREAFRRVQPADMNAYVEWAHSDGLQLLVTGGAIGLLLGGTALLWMLVLFARAFVRQRHREEAAWALAGFGALLALLLHGIVEFNLSMPAIPATLSMTLGCAWAAASRD